MKLKYSDVFQSLKILLLYHVVQVFPLNLFYILGMGIVSYLKSNFIIHLLLGYVFVVSGLIVCFCMLLTYICVWPWNKSLYRKIVCNLAYAHWSRK